MEQEKEYTITIFSENKMGLMARIVANITRRHINIESLSVSKSSIEGIHRFTIIVILTHEKVRKLVAQLDKQVDVLKAFYYDNSEVVYQEIALYKVSTKAFTNGGALKQLISKFEGRILSVEHEYLVVEKTGLEIETEALLEELKPFGVFEFVRSGRVAIVKQMERLNNYLNKTEMENVGLRSN